MARIAIAAFYGWMHALAEEAVQWTTRAGVPERTARNLVLETIRSAAAMGLARPDQPLPALLSQLATPGGMTEHGLEELRRKKAFQPWSESLDAVLERIKLRDSGRGPGSTAPGR